MARRLPKSNVIRGRVTQLRRYLARVKQVVNDRLGHTLCMNIYEQFGEGNLMYSSVTVDQDKVTTRGRPFKLGDVAEIWTWTTSAGKDRVHLERPKLPVRVLKRE